MAEQRYAHNLSIESETPLLLEETTMAPPSRTAVQWLKLRSTKIVRDEALMLAM
jgi:hypothetical protein